MESSLAIGQRQTYRILTYPTMIEFWTSRVQSHNSPTVECRWILRYPTLTNFWTMVVGFQWYPTVEGCWILQYPTLTNFWTMVVGFQWRPTVECRWIMQYPMMTNFWTMVIGFQWHPTTSTDLGRVYIVASTVISVVASWRSLSGSNDIPNSETLGYDREVFFMAFDLAK